MDHPHGRGDGARANSVVKGIHGSPPRAWGRHSTGVRSSWIVRITPTGVGTAWPGARRAAAAADHPHGRGDGATRSPGLISRPGSPPRAWGRPVPVHIGSGDERITPTGVGTARHVSRGTPPRTDHPHGRGDGGARRGARELGHGSPPRAWGRHHIPSSDVVAGRITPTGVGTATSHSQTGARNRITPTGVGTAAGVAWVRRCGPDHPHGRGDGTTRISARQACDGSPPRAWGRPSKPRTCPGAGRITPTGVGTASVGSAVTSS